MNGQMNWTDILKRKNNQSPINTHTKSVCSGTLMVTWSYMMYVRVCVLRNTDGHKGTSTETWMRQGKVFATVTRSYMMCVCVLRNTDGNTVLHDVCVRVLRNTDGNMVLHRVYVCSGTRILAKAILQKPGRGKGRSLRYSTHSIHSLASLCLQ